MFQLVPVTPHPSPTQLQEEFGSIFFTTSQSVVKDSNNTPPFHLLL